MSQIGEFSLIALTLALGLGYISSETLSTVTLVSIITITLSSYLITHTTTLTKLLYPLFFLFEHKKEIQTNDDSPIKDHIVLFGAHRMGQAVLKNLQKQHSAKEIIVVDMNPSIIKSLEKEKFSVIYGDMIDPDTLEATNIAMANLVISTTPEFEANIAIIKKIKKNHRHRTYIYVTAKTSDEALTLYKAGADYVLLPQYLTGEYVCQLINDFGQEPKLLGHRKKHIQELEKYLETGI
jgi:voltage-gated potassium channel Kch